MVVNELLMQFQSDILDAPVVRPRVIETTALGAALRRGSPRVSGIRPATSPPTGGSTRAGGPRWRATSAKGFFKQWNKAVSRSFDWE